VWPSSSVEDSLPVYYAVENNMHFAHTLFLRDIISSDLAFYVFAVFD